MRLSCVKLVVSACCLLLASITPAGAQQKSPVAVGPIEAGVFGQIDWLDKAMQTDRVGFGGGGRLGWFVNSRWELEAEASLSRAKPSTKRIQTGDVEVNYYIGRLNYNVPIGSMMGIISAGAGANALDDHSDLILSPLLGLRIPLSDSWHVRLDASGMFAPNPTSATYKFPAPPGGIGATKNEDAAYLTNVQARIGLSWLPWGKSAPETVTVAVSVSRSPLQLVCSGATVTGQLSARVTSNTRPEILQGVTWRAEDPSTATVDANGLVTAMRAGNARFTATSVAAPTVQGSTSVTVNGTTMTATRTVYDTTYPPAIPATALDTAIFFQTDSPKVARRNKTQIQVNRIALRDSAQRTLDQWVDFLKKYPQVTLTVQGWADIRASEAYNLALSQRRADAAAEYLTERGIDRSRITAITNRGETEEFAAGKSPAALQKNRRAKVTITPGSDKPQPTVTARTIPGSCQP